MPVFVRVGGDEIVLNSVNESFDTGKLFTVGVIFIVVVYVVTDE